MNIYWIAAALTVATPAAAQVADTTHAGHNMPAPADKAMPAHAAMMANGKMKPDADMMERCKKMHAAMPAKPGATPDKK
ncbi:hypothetical protein DAH55_10620 [Sphingomonas koreensis]|uniref:hypothetical protein n=1 Tax=Sphingomonas koreensis TaxID=93064 RepID=UPI00082E7D90|nr:hypothetical protein [Sphingomonas koreensis]PJI87237.1 hypothetical protein BDW16_0469 [Sphingomonas koreensis]RSU59552.1 hypothetical protein DAH56_11245 [Sphingomonas koreensis]RSU68705.1 hypothetical protein DAH55_10620 [Sphingomonas koreensis]